MDLVRDNQNLHKFGLQVQQLLAAELFGFDNINNLKWELKREFGYSVDEKAEEFGYPSFKDMLDSKVLDNYVEIEKGRFSEGGQMVQTRYKAKHDRHTTAVRQQQIIFQREKERKEERRQRQMERNFDAQMWRPSEKFGQPSAGGKSFSNYYESQQQQNHRFYAQQREHSPAMEMNGALDSNWYTNEDDDNNRNNNSDVIDNVDGREEVSDSDGASAKLAADYSNFFGASKWPSNLYNNTHCQAKPTAKEQQKQHKSPPKKVGGVSEWSSGSGDEQQQPSEEEEKPKPAQEQKLTTKHKFVGISSWTKTDHPKEQQQQQPKQQPQEQHVSVPQKSAKLISLSSDEEEEEETRRKPPPPMARHANKKPLSVTALKKIIWSEDEDNTDETKGHGGNSPPPAMFAPLSANSAAGTSAANNTASTSNYNNATGTSNFGFDCPPVDSNPSRWSAETLCRWLTAAGLADCAQRLLNEEVDGACLLLFTPINYQNLGLKLGPMVKLQQIAEYLRQFTFADNR